MQREEYIVKCMYAKGYWIGNKIMPTTDRLELWQGRIEAIPSNIWVATAKQLQRITGTTKPIFVRGLTYQRIA